MESAQPLAYQPLPATERVPKAPVKAALRPFSVSDNTILQGIYGILVIILIKVKFGLSIHKILAESWNLIYMDSNGKNLLNTQQL